VRRSDPVFRPFFVGHGDLLGTLTEGVVVGAEGPAGLTSAVTNSAWAGVHVDLGAATVPDQRGRGLATGAAWAVCSELLANGRKPVWVAGESNRPSWRIPEKLGFRFVGRRSYVVFDEFRAHGYRPT
jgi:RimJ/RimL family protein N-acetyltransferase